MRRRKRGLKDTAGPGADAPGVARKPASKRWLAVFWFARSTAPVRGGPAHGWPPARFLDFQFRHGALCRTKMPAWFSRALACCGRCAPTEYSMPKRMLIDASHPEETRVVVLRGNRVEEFDFEAADRQQL